MSFAHLGFFPLILLAFSGLAILLIRYEAKAYLWVEKYWFYKRTTLNKISSVFFLLAIFLFLLSLLDLRGPSQSKKSIVPDQKTIIIVDSSASMLTEDVRPNRFLKSLLLARHFVKSAYGHQIAIVLFSDFQKRIIPFTDDLELLDSRIEALENKIISKGSSNIGQAISESVQYFKEASKSKDTPTGNILLFTDSDETRVDFEINVPDGISLAVVAVATRSGGPIPLKDARGNFFGYKNYKGQKVISKLDDSFLKGLKNKVKNYRYWEISTYNLPTDEILGFFNNIFKNKISERNIDIRPVLTQYLVIIGIFLYIISVLLSRGKNLALMVLIIILPIFSTKASEKDFDGMLEKFKKGKLNKDEIFNLAEKLLKAQKAKEAAVIYQENLPLKKMESSINHGTAMVISGDFDKGLEKYRGIMENIEASNISQKGALINLLRNNVLMALKEQEKQKQQDEKKKKEEKEKQEKDKGDSSKQSQDGEGDKKEEKEGDKTKDQEKEDKEKNKDKEKEKDPLKEKEEQIKAGREKNKIPAMIKQILDDDRNLQQMYIDTSTQKRDQNEEVKDW
jgi:Ca-activated chloride channel family protein